MFRNPIVLYAEWQADALLGGRTSSSGVLKWDDGTEVDISLFQTGEPNGSGDCLRVYFRPGEFPKFDDFDCSYTSSYVCERETSEA